MLTMLLAIALAVGIACGGPAQENAVVQVAAETVQTDQPTTVAEGADTVVPATATSMPADADPQTPTQAPAQSATSANPTATQSVATVAPTPTASATDMATGPAEPSEQPTQTPTTTPAPPPTATQTPLTVDSEPSPTAVPPERDFDVITLLPPDAIPALNSPGYHDTTEEADESYQDDDLVLGIEINGDARAFSVPLLSRHEIVNDVIGGEPVAVTW